MSVSSVENKNSAAATSAAGKNGKAVDTANKIKGSVDTALAAGGHRTTTQWVSQPTHRGARQWIKQGNHRSVWEWFSGVPSRNK